MSLDMRPLAGLDAQELEGRGILTPQRIRGRRPQTRMARTQAGLNTANIVRLADNVLSLEIEMRIRQNAERIQRNQNIERAQETAELANIVADLRGEVMRLSIAREVGLLMEERRRREATGQDPDEEEIRQRGYERAERNREAANRRVEVRRALRLADVIFEEGEADTFALTLTGTILLGLTIAVFTL